MRQLTHFILGCLFSLLATQNLASEHLIHGQTANTTNTTPATNSIKTTKLTQTPEKTRKTETTSHPVIFELFTDNITDIKLKQILEDTQTFARIKRMIEQNFSLKAPLRFHIQHQQAAKFVTTKVTEKSDVITLPYGFLHTLYQGISQKYEHQADVINVLFSASTEFFIWSEFAEYLIKQHKLDINGPRFFAKDNLATIMMLNQNNANGDYLADASEAYLLIHSAQPQLGQTLQNELLQDQQRYRHILCLTMGFEKRLQATSNESMHLSSFSLSEEKIQQCMLKYDTLLKNWFQAMKPFLRTQNLIHHWLKTNNQ